MIPGGGFLTRFALLLALCGAAEPCTAALAEPRISGRLQGFYLHQQAGPSGFDATGTLAVHRLRLELAAAMTSALQAEIALEGLTRWQDTTALDELQPTTPARALDLEKSWSSNRLQEQQLNIDRLALHHSRDQFDWSLGRQALGFGRISLVSPLDLLAPFPPDALDTDVRPGVDALRLVRYSGLGGQVAGTLVFGRKSRDHSALITVSHSQQGIDLLLLAGLLRERSVAGLGLAGSLGGLGLKAELAGFSGRDPGQPGGDLRRQFLQGALEAWYRFDLGLVVLAEYLHNGSGTRHPGEYPAAVASAAFQEGLTYLAGRDYLLLAPSAEIHPLVTLGGLAMYNLHDHSLLLRPQCTLSLDDNLNLQLFWSESFGEVPLRDSAVGRVRSEFGTVGASGGLLIKYFF